LIGFVARFPRRPSKLLPGLVTVVPAETSELMSVDVGVGVSCAQAGDAGARAGMRAKAPTALAALRPALASPADDHSRKGAQIQKNRKKPPAGADLRRVRREGQSVVVLGNGRLRGIVVRPPQGATDYRVGSLPS
jgi:hypothetical protein